MSGTVGMDGEANWCCWGYRCAVMTSMLLLLSSFAGFYFLYLEMRSGMKVDFGIPQLFPPDSNLGISMIILQHYKSGLFSTSVDMSATAVGVYTNTPTALPTVGVTARPTHTAIPTRSPTAVVGNPTNRPTLAPSTVQTAIPSAAPTAAYPTSRTNSPTPAPDGRPRKQQPRSEMLGNV